MCERGRGRGVVGGRATQPRRAPPRRPGEPKPTWVPPLRATSWWKPARAAALFAEPANGSGWQPWHQQQELPRIKCPLTVQMTNFVCVLTSRVYVMQYAALQLLLSLGTHRFFSPSRHGSARCYFPLQHLVFLFLLASEKFLPNLGREDDLKENWKAPV